MSYQRKPHPKPGRDSSLPAMSKRQRPARGNRQPITQEITNMAITVQELVQKLNEFPADAEIAIENLDDDQEFFIVSFNPGDNRLTIVITDEEEEEEEN
ncbi:hypothetical protein [Nostoc sp.]